METTKTKTKTKTDSLSRISAEEIVYSPALLSKLRSIAKSKRFRTRTLTAGEVAELAAAEHKDSLFGTWFMFKGHQLTVTPQADGSAILFAF